MNVGTCATVGAGSCISTGESTFGKSGISTGGDSTIDDGDILYRTDRDFNIESLVGTDPAALFLNNVISLDSAN